MAAADDVRIALFLDYDNLAIGARDRLGIQFDLAPISDALAEIGRVVVRRAYADWTMFEPDGRRLARQQVELIEIPQRMGSARKNAADIKMAVDAMELAFERDYLTHFVFCTGDSDFTPLVHKLREHDKRVLGFGIKASTSELLPAACDEFMFYETLEGVEPRKGRGSRGGGGGSRGGKRGQGGTGTVVGAGTGSGTGTSTGNGAGETSPPANGEEGRELPKNPTDIPRLERLIGRTLAGLQRNSDGPIRASALKRALLRKVSTFSEAEFGFRSFGELLRFLQKRKSVELGKSGSRGDPEVNFPEQDTGEEAAFQALRDAVDAAFETEGPPPLSGLKNKLRRKIPDFSEKAFGYSGFLQFCKAAATLGWIELEWDEEADDYLAHALEDVEEDTP